MIYLIDEDKCRVNPNDIDFENYNKLNEFKKILSTKHTIDKFVDETDLVKKIDERLKIILQLEDIKDNYRPRRIECKVKNVKIKNVFWTIIIGYRNNMPYEIFFTPKCDAYIPEYANFGWILLNYDERNNPRYDFQMEDKNGYKMTIEGIHRMSEMHSFLLLELLLLNASMKTIIRIFEKLSLRYEDIPLDLIKYACKIIELK